MPVYVSSTVVLIIRRSKLYYTVSGIITPVDGRPVHRYTWRHIPEYKPSSRRHENPKHHHTKQELNEI